MKDGFIKVGAAVPEVRPGDCDFNADRIIECINTAHEAGVRVLVLPELCVTGYTCGDLFLHGELLKNAENALSKIAAATERLDIVYTVGVPLCIEGKVCNCAAVYLKGEQIGFVTKEHLTQQERRWFTSLRRSILFKDVYCTELAFEVVIGCDKPRTGASIVLQMTAEPKMTGKSEYRLISASVLSYENHCILVSANAGNGESTASAVFYSDMDDTSVYENGRRIDCNGQHTGISDADAGFIAYERRRCGYVPG